MNVTTKSSIDTEKEGFIFSKKILKNKKPIIIALKGEIGGGKTTFVKGLARGLGIKEEVNSPTFVIFKIYKSIHGNLYHFDCYRIKKPKEILRLGFKDIISDKNNIIVIEWSENIEKIIPKNSIILNFEFIDKNKRRIVLN